MNIKNKTIASMKAIALDSINKAKQGHTGMAIGAAHITYSLVGEELNFSSKNKINKNLKKYLQHILLKILNILILQF